MNSFIKKIKSFSQRFNLWQEGNKILVGVSGGPDSVCLLDILFKLKKRYKFEILVAHVNYGLRGADSDGDEAFVRELADKYNFKFSILPVCRRGRNLNSISNEKILNKNSEAKMRDVRYRFFEKVRKENNFDLIAVAHNKDDQAETILMRLIRGSGLLGLSSMRPKNGVIIRPLLEISRREIINYLKANKLKYRIDKTNKENNFLRNKIRNNLIPYLEKNYNLSIRETLSGAAGSIADDYDFINRSSLNLIKNICSFKDDGVQLSVKKIEKVHPSMQKQVLRQSIFRIKNDLINIDNSHIEEILKIIKSRKGKSQKVSFGGLKVARKGDIIQIVI